MFALLRRFRIPLRIWSIVAYAALGLIISGVLTTLSVRDALFKERQQGMVHIVETALSLVNAYYEQAQRGELAEAEAQRMAMEVVGRIRYGSSGGEGQEYLWINDLQPRVLMHPIRPELNGTDVSGIADPNGKHLFVEFVKVVRSQGAGFVDYYWPKPGHQEPVPKISYVAHFQPWGWIIGSGVYVDTIHEVAADHARKIALHYAAILALLVFVSTFAAWSITRPLAKTVTVIRTMANDDGRVDLTHRLETDGHDELTELAHSVNQLATASQQALKEAQQANRDVLAAAGTLHRVTSNTSRNMERQQAETEQLATAMTEMAATVHEVAHSTTTAAEAAHNAEEQTARGRAVVNDSLAAIQKLAQEMVETRESIERLAADAESIGSVLDVINGIADQTNLLALNAAIEAARAGEAGRGFAVVADEVRALATRTQEATGRVKASIEQIQSGTRQAAARILQSAEHAEHTAQESSRTGDSLSAITAAVATISDMNAQIASAAEEQSAAADEINRNVIAIREITIETTQGVSLIRDAANELNELVRRLDEAMKNVRL